MYIYIKTYILFHNEYASGKIGPRISASTSLSLPLRSVLCISSYSLRNRRWMYSSSLSLPHRLQSSPVAFSLLHTSTFTRSLGCVGRASLCFFSLFTPSRRLSRRLITPRRASHKTPFNLGQREPPANVWKRRRAALNDVGSLSSPPLLARIVFYATEFSFLSASPSPSLSFFLFFHPLLRFLHLITEMTRGIPVGQTRVRSGHPPYYLTAF